MRATNADRRLGAIYTLAGNYHGDQQLLIGANGSRRAKWLESDRLRQLTRRPRGQGRAAERRRHSTPRERHAKPIPAHERAAILDRMAALLAERADEAARTISPGRKSP
jgi:acyl-CoA reductase-like NAD-dependent aldehyde dehydrogenase